MIAVIGGRVLDSTALAAFAIGRPVYMRALVWAAIPGALLVTGFLHGAELTQARALLARLREGGLRPRGSES